jgi:hypothetical protein
MSRLQYHSGIWIQALEYKGERERVIIEKRENVELEKRL